jgi:hypothetical protein
LQTVRKSIGKNEQKKEPSIVLDMSDEEEEEEEIIPDEVKETLNRMISRSNKQMD